MATLKAIGDFISTNKTGVIVTGSALALGTGAALYATSRKRKSKSKSKSRKRVHRSTKRKSRKQKKPYTAGKRKDRSHRRIRYTKNNQPYVILASGKARFISKRSVSLSRKRKGGRY